MSLLKISGESKDGKMVLGGFFALRSTHGIPLEEMLMFARDNDILIDWEDFIQSAISEGMSPRGVASTIDAASTEIFGIHHAREIKRRARHIIIDVLEKRKAMKHGQ
ncbi:hypothetical protein [uncultured Paraglaciecola sp.]|uniref:hypothetical protein n=1 Tax=uncultured Paraglaciecola sp. TaxID=1765024 RepID=UPI002603EBE1|nr:hypothetical protein [uncultured Paraglaciecola sp.]